MVLLQRTVTVWAGLTVFLSCMFFTMDVVLILSVLFMFLMDFYNVFNVFATYCCFVSCLEAKG